MEKHQWKNIHDNLHEAVFLLNRLYNERMVDVKKPIIADVLCEMMERVGVDYEMIVLDDGSDDYASIVLVEVK